jgi:hypothetical protein
VQTLLSGMCRWLQEYPDSASTCYSDPQISRKHLANAVTGGVSTNTARLVIAGSNAMTAQVSGVTPDLVSTAVVSAAFDATALL